MEVDKLKELKLTIFGKLLQKGNTFEVAYRRGRGGGRGVPFIRHTDEYVSIKEDFEWQIKAQLKGISFDEPVLVFCSIYYPTASHDLDESMLMDALERGGAYTNDRLVFQKWSEKFKDKEHPRIEVTIVPAFRGEIKITPRGLEQTKTLEVEVVKGVFKVIE